MNPGAHAALATSGATTKDGSRIGNSYLFRFGWQIQCPVERQSNSPWRQVISRHLSLGHLSAAPSTLDLDVQVGDLSTHSVGSPSLEKDQSGTDGGGALRLRSACQSSGPRLPGASATFGFNSGRVSDSGLACFGDDVSSEALLDDQRGVVRETRGMVEIEGFGWVLELVAEGAYERWRARRLCGEISPGTRSTSLEGDGRSSRLRCSLKRPWKSLTFANRLRR